MSYKTLEQTGNEHVSFHFSVTPGKTECLSNPNAKYCCPKGMVGRPNVESNGFEYTRFAIPSPICSTKQKNMSEMTALVKNPYCGNCDNCNKSNVCSWATSGQNSDCIRGIATLKEHGWPMPEKSQTNADRDGNYYPCCYLGDMWCKGTNQQNGKFKETIAYMNKNFGKEYGFNIDTDSDDNICKQMGCGNW